MLLQNIAPRIHLSMRWSQKRENQSGGGSGGGGYFKGVKKALSCVSYVSLKLGGGEWEVDLQTKPDLLYFILQ